MSQRERFAARPDPGVHGRAHLPVLTAGEAAEADRVARESYGIPGRVLMESAGRAAAQVFQRIYPEGRVVGVAGPGNNGGDLLVMLRVLHAWGRDVSIISAAGRDLDHTLLHGASVPLLDAAAAVEAAGRADVFVDGMLGTGARGEPRGPVAEWIGRIATSSRPVMSLDIPTGVDATTGRVHDAAVRAAVTVMFGWPKLGLMLHPAREHCGRLIAVEIGFPDACAQSRTSLITSSWARDNLRPRDATAHKSSVGRLLVLAGQEGMAGAAVIAVRAATRAGAGLIRVASAGANRVVLQSVVPEATFLDRTRIVQDDVYSMNGVLAGPGLGTDAEARAALERALALTPGKPALLDADALNILAEQGGLRRIADDRPVIITPHVRELGRLTGRTPPEILGDMPAAARSAARDFNCVVLLKGQPSLVATAAGDLYINTVGSSDVATAGMGDQLAGTCAALLAGGCDPAASASLGLFMSGRAADLAGLGRSLAPDDVSEHLARAIADPGPRQSDLDLPFVTFDQRARW